MLNFSHQTRVFLFMEPVDMRKSFRGLCLLAESVLKEDPASGHWFAFINRRRDRLKLLGWDGQGFWIWYKRLESGRLREAREPGESRANGNRRDATVVDYQRHRSAFGETKTSLPTIDLMSPEKNFANGCQCSCEIGADVHTLHYRC